MIRLISCQMVVTISALCLVGCGGEIVPTNFSLSGPHQVSNPGKPFTTYLVVTRPGGNREFVYFLIVKPPVSPTGGQSQTSSSESSAAGLNGKAKSKLVFNGKEVTVEYKMTVHPDGTLETESFEIGGKKQPFDKGRVFLVDLSTEPISIVPHDVALRITIPETLNNPMAAESFADSTLKVLEEDPAIAEFTRALR